MSFMFSVGASKDDASTEHLQKGRLPSGQQRHQETKPLHLAITEKLAVLRFSQGAGRGAMFYSLVCSCRLNGVNFFEYISDVINKAAALPPNTPLEKYRMLLPDKWKENR